MNDKRYFYTDPLAAAWMAKHFGMRFSVHPQVISQHFDLIDVDAMDEDFSVEPTNGDQWLFYVHSDSLRLLNPQPNDQLHCPNLYKTYRAIPDSPRYPHEINAQYARECNLRVIQRNGVVFHWPQSVAIESTSA